MSLRARIVFLFCAFSVLPLLILAEFTYWQVNTLIDEVPGLGTSVALREALSRLDLTYWLFAIGLALATVLAFTIALSGLTSNLRHLIRASEKIGEGDLNAWLPPPADGEVGRLNLALGQMMERLRAMVEQVDRQGRLAAVGQVSAYLAHEIRTPLSSTRMNLQRLQRWARDGKIPPMCVEPIEISLKEVERLTTAVSGILALTRPSQSAPVPIEIHGAIQHAAELLQGEMAARGIELRLDLDAVADRVMARPGQLKGVILNLLLNSMEAQPQGGRIEVASQLMRSPDATAPLLEIRIRDQGPGVPAEIRNRIWDPFFTTKEQGTGIGLALAAQAVRENGGEIHLEERAAPGAGAEFVILLPLAPVALQEHAPTLAGSASVWGGSKRDTDEARSERGVSSQTVPEVS